jgi:UDP-2,3-diacylglucosamine pyrophosphatase LpxH
MKKKISSLLSIRTARQIGRLLLFTSLLIFCDKLYSAPASDPFTNGSKERNMIVVISDIHLGADLAYAETNKNLKPLAHLIGQISISPNVKELVIAGDLLDEWFVPATTDTYQGKDQADFVKRIANANKEVIDAINRIIRDGKILVTYVPGNHDLTIAAENVAAILPGIHQSRDKELGLGTYSPADHPEVAIEHGHRYNFFCAPDPISNQDVAPGTIMPPGYFFTRIAALHVVQNCRTPHDSIPQIVKNNSGDESQALLFGYYGLWKTTLTMFRIENRFDEKMIVTKVNGFADSYSVKDLLPFQPLPGGSIDVKLYKGIQDSWNQRQKINHVAVNIPVAQAMRYVGDAAETDRQSELQYFMNPNSNKRIVVFGHTHVAKISSYDNHKGQKSIYANSGTWIDHNPKLTTMNFVVITPQNGDAASQTYVKLYNFEGEIVTEMDEKSIQF